VAVVGTGIAGLTCAHVLGPHHDVVVFEADARLGGHANTVEVGDPEAGSIGVDTGFLVYNERNYPNLLRLFAELGVATAPSTMSFSVTDRAAGFSYRATNPNTLFAHRKNLARPAMWKMLADIGRFFRIGRRTLASSIGHGPPDHSGVSLGEFLSEHRFGPEFVSWYLLPLGSAIWSADPTTFDQFPAVSLLRFLDQHGLLGVRHRPPWRTVAGGSRAYVAEICPVEGVSRSAASGRPGPAVAVRAGGATHEFDHVVLACHSDQALAVLDDARPTEKDVLGAIRFQANRATLHTDTRLMPPSRRAWAAWNYDRQDAAMATMTYDITALQHLAGRERYLVSLNSEDRINPDRVLEQIDYAHPVLDGPAVVAQARIAEVSGADRVHFCGAWTGYGFHEDGVVSGLRVARDLGVHW
jgi:uncharacterized protein